MLTNLIDASFVSLLAIISILFLYKTCKTFVKFVRFCLMTSVLPPVIFFVVLKILAIALQTTGAADYLSEFDVVKESKFVWILSNMTTGDGNPEERVRFLGQQLTSTYFDVGNDIGSKIWTSRKS